MVAQRYTGTVRQVNENQCQSCMPLGGVIAFKGIENAMVLVHGSQGCSTYMRLTSIEHYNEHLGQMRLTRQLWENRHARPHEI